MAKEREPYNSAFCKDIKCDNRKGNKCNLEECVHNFKWIKYWEIYGVYPPGGGE